MANALYDNGRRGFLTSVTVGAFVGNLDWVADTVHAVLVDTAIYTASLTADTSMTQVGATARIADVALTTKTASTDGTALAASATFPSVAAGSTAGAIVLYRDNGTATDADNALIAYIDTATNLPVTTNGGDITIVWGAGSGDIFKL